MSLSKYEINNVEDDMQKHKYYNNSKNAWVYQAFAETPLLGNKIFTDKGIENLYNKAKKCIEYLKTYNKNKHKKVYDDDKILLCQMIVTLIIIHYAKNWDNTIESKFWKYISEQFGYRYTGSADVTVKIFQECIKKSMKINKRWFVFDKNFASSQNQYVSTVLTHAFSPKEAWLKVCDFLFEFYRINMNLSYEENDPIIYRMINALQSKLFAKETQEDTDTDLDIGSKTYTFRLGIKNLIKCKPKYTALLFSQIIRRIDDILTNMAEPTNCYVEKLVDEWWTLRLSEISEIKPKQRVRSINIAKDYESIHPKYILTDNMKIQIEFPEMRLEQIEFNEIKLKVYINKNVVREQTLEYFGNELGKTIAGFSIDVFEYINGDEDTFNIQAIIICDEKVIYDSKNSLFRDVFCFAGKREKNISSCKPGQYSVFYPCSQKIDFIGAETTPVDGINKLEAFFVSLQDDFLIKSDYKIIAQSKTPVENKEKIHIIPLNPNKGIVFWYNDIPYGVVPIGESINITANEENDIKKLAIFMNDKKISPNNLMREKLENGYLYGLPLTGNKDNICKIKIIDIEKNAVLIDKEFYLSSISWNFDKPVYYLSEDYENAHIVLKVNDEEHIVCFNSEQDILSIELANGVFDIEIPKISICKGNGEKWNICDKLIKKDIELTEKIVVYSPDSFNVKVTIGDTDIKTLNNGYFALGNAANVYNFANTDNGANLSVTVQNKSDKREYIIGKIYGNERFVEKPIFYYEFKTLKWNMGMGFIGSKETELTLIVNVEGEEHKYPLNLKNEIVIEWVDLPLGRYPFKIVKAPDNVLFSSEEILATGKLNIGDINELRFNNSLIKIEALTNNDNQSVRIASVYIKDIEYRGIQYVSSEEKECPIYSGTMFYRKQDGTERKFSEYEYKYDHNSYYKVNPVTIVCINEHVLSIKNCDGDGLYYRRFQFKNNGGISQNIYRIVDIEPTKANQKEYHVAELYVFEKERL